MAGEKIDYARLRAFLTRLDTALHRPGVLFLLGGSSLTWRGLKQDSADVDLALAEGEPDPLPLLDAIEVAADFVEAIVDVIRRDTVDVGNMLAAGLIDCAALYQHFESVLARIPRGVSRSDKEDFRRKVETFYAQHCE